MPRGKANDQKKDLRRRPVDWRQLSQVDPSHVEAAKRVSELAESIGFSELTGRRSLERLLSAHNAATMSGKDSRLATERALLGMRDDVDIAIGNMMRGPDTGSPSNKRMEADVGVRRRMSGEDYALTAQDVARIDEGQRRTRPGGLSFNPHVYKKDKEKGEDPEKS